MVEVHGTGRSYGEDVWYQRPGHVHVAPREGGGQRLGDGQLHQQGQAVLHHEGHSSGQEQSWNIHASQGTFCEHF